MHVETETNNKQEKTLPHNTYRKVMRFTKAVGRRPRSRYMTLLQVGGIS